jgi:2'-5' RNA ligase
MNPSRNSLSSALLSACLSCCTPSVTTPFSSTQSASLESSNEAMLASQPLTTSMKLADGTGEPFLKHNGAGFGSYLAINLPFAPAEKLRKQVEDKAKIKLKNRGESHITVLTPPEFNNIISKKLSIGQVDAIAAKHHIQKARIDVVCVGRFSKEGKQVYFVVVSSNPLIEIRQAIAAEFQAAGGEPRAFDPLHFQPHITLGFTDSDLHESDGAIKDERSCIYPVQMTP